MIPLCAYLLGYAFSLLVPLWPLKWISVNLWLALAIKAGIPRDDAVKEHRLDLPLLVGLLERFIYTAAFVSNREFLIGVWLALKSSEVGSAGPMDLPTRPRRAMNYT
jgi:putative Ca2+/H+ antiporter (TMEM165/GDT1 family)